FLAAFTFIAFFTALFSAFFVIFFFATFFNVFFFTIFFAGLAAFLIGAFARFGTTTASVSRAGLASMVSTSRQPWASRTAIMADKMSVQVCWVVMTSLGNMQPSQQM